MPRTTKPKTTKPIFAVDERAMLCYLAEVFVVLVKKIGGIMYYRVREDINKNLYKI
jgi:hypothetical protein